MYIELPQDLAVDRQGLVYKLNKSLYGLKQASRQWCAKLTEALCFKGYTHTMNDYSLFCKRTKGSTIYVVIYVDDIVLKGTYKKRLRNWRLFFTTTSKIKDLGRLHYFLGLEVLYKGDEVIISQRKFALYLLKEYNRMDYNTLSSPLDPTIKLNAKEWVVLKDPTYYRKLVRKLNFLTNTTLDITYSVQYLIQFMDDPREPDLK